MTQTPQEKGEGQLVIDVESEITRRLGFKHEIKNIFKTWLSCEEFLIRIPLSSE